MQDQTPLKYKAGYRKGMVLGLTIAEIILLLLFALLLALAAGLIKANKGAAENATLRTMFDEAVAALDAKDGAGFKKAVQKVLSDGAAVEKKYKDKVTELESRLIPESLNQELILKKIDLNREADREKFFALMNTAAKVETEAKKSNRSTEALAAKACEVGAEAMRRSGPDVDPKSITNQIEEQKRQIDYWKGKATQQGKGGTLPNCYSVKGGKPFVYLYRADIHKDGISLVSLLPEELAAQFAADFSNPPPIGRRLSDNEFLSLTKAFLDYGERRDCRFSIQSKDQTDAGDKNRYKRGRTVLGGNFYETPVQEDR